MKKSLPIDDLNHVLDHTRDLWEGVRGEQIFVTGGTGFFGCWLLETFAYANTKLRLNARLVALTRDAEAFRQKMPHIAINSAIGFLKGDVRDFDFPAEKFSHVIHAATCSSAPVPPLEMFETIVGGTRRVLDFAVNCGSRKFLLISSGAVYGRQPADLAHIPETWLQAPDPFDPNSAYGEGKRASELLCAIYQKQYGVGATIARCFAFVGPHLPLDAHFAIGNFIRDAIGGNQIRIGGDGTPVRSYLYAADLAIWLWTMLFRGIPGRPYNVGSPEPLSIEELAHAVARNLAPECSVSVAIKANSTNPPLRYVPDMRRAGGELGLRVWIPLDDAIQRTAAWHK